MSGEDSEHLIDTLDGLFDGASPTNFIALWDPNQFESGLPVDAPEIENHTSPFRVSWHRRYLGGSLYHGLEIPSQVTAAREADWKSVLDRCICHLAIDLIPDKGLAEIKQQLIQALEFYSHESLPSLPQLTERRTAQVSRRYDREVPVLE